MPMTVPRKDNDRRYRDFAAAVETGTAKRYDLDSYFHGVPVEAKYAREALWHWNHARCRFEPDSARGPRYVVSVHGNLWYEVYPHGA